MGFLTSIFEKKRKDEGKETKKSHMLKTTPLMNPYINPLHNNTSASQEFTDYWSKRVSL